MYHLFRNKFRLGVHICVPTVVVAIGDQAMRAAIEIKKSLFEFTFMDTEVSLRRCIIHQDSIVVRYDRTGQEMSL